MESAEKQTPRWSGNAYSNGNNIKSGQDRITPHINKSVVRAQSMNTNRDKSSNVGKGEANEKFSETKNPHDVSSCRTVNCSNVYNLKPRKTSQITVYAMKRPYKRRSIIPNDNYSEGITQNDSSNSSDDKIVNDNHQLVHIKRKYNRSTALINPMKTVISVKKANRRGAKPLSSSSSSQDIIEEHERIMNKFQCPTQFYLFLAKRNSQRRLFAYRNLSYLMPNSKRVPRRRPSLEEVINRLKQNCLQNHLIESDSSRALKLDHSILPPGEWPQEIEFIFDGLYDSDKEFNWVTINASVDIYLQFRWAWRRKSCPDVTRLKINNTPIRINCYSQTTGYSSIINNSGSSTNSSSSSNNGHVNNSNNNHEREDKRKQLATCRFPIIPLLDQAEWQASGSRLIHVQVELDISAVEKRVKNTTTNNNLSSSNQNNKPSQPQMAAAAVSSASSCSSLSSTSLVGGNPTICKRSFISPPHHVNYVAYPLPLITTPYNFSTSSALRQFHLTPRPYDLRLTHPHDESVTATTTTPTNGEENSSHEIFSFIKQSGDGTSSLGSGSTSTSSSSIQSKKRIRIPESPDKAATVVDDYTLWPSLRFTVLWHKKPTVDNNNQPNTISRLVGTRSQDVKNNSNNINNNNNINIKNSPTEGRVSYTRSMTNSLIINRDSIKKENDLTPIKNSPSTPAKVSTIESHTNTNIINTSLSNGILSQDLLSSSTSSSSNHSIHEIKHSISSSSASASSPALSSSSCVVPGEKEGRGEGGGEVVVAVAANQSTSESTESKPSNHLVTYGLVHANGLLQWAESSNLICPWCFLDCSRAKEKGFEALLVHLRTSHARFRFKAKWNATRDHLSLHISLNDSYDGSNDVGLLRWSVGLHKKFITRRHIITANQIAVVNDNGGASGGRNGGSGWKIDPSTRKYHNNNNIIKKSDDLHNDDGDKSDQYSSNSSNNNNTIIQANLRIRCPIRRFPYTHMIFWRGMERTSKSELNSTLSVQPMLVGHNRVYYHTTTTQPIRACEFDLDSDDEDAPGWLRQHYQRRLEEFNDVNQGEIKFMELWNYFLLSIRPSTLITTDKDAAVTMCLFLMKYSRLIYTRHLRTNLLLHLNNLADYDLLSSEQVFQLMSMYDAYVSSLKNQLFLQNHHHQSLVFNGASGNVTRAATSTNLGGNVNIQSSAALWASPLTISLLSSVKSTKTSLTGRIPATMKRGAGGNNNNNNNNNAGESNHYHHHHHNNHKRGEIKIRSRSNPSAALLGAFRTSFTS